MLLHGGCKSVFFSPGLGNTGLMRKFGVEEELLLIDAATGVLAPVADDLLRTRAKAGSLVPGDAVSSDGPAGTMTHELKQEQVELVSAPYDDLSALMAAIAQGRMEADRLASTLGTRAVAMGTYPMRAASRLVRSPRFAAMEKRYGITLKEQLT